MDVQIDCGAIYFGLKQIKNIESFLNSLSSAMSGVTLPSELTTASLLSDAKTKISSIINGDIKELIEIFEESKNILTKNDNHAALLFQYYEEGIIDEDGNFTDVPLLTQNDYSYITYGGNNVATSGCGITSLCMVASYIMDRLYTPEDLAAIANADKSSNVGKMTTAADYVGLNWFCDKTTSKEDLENYLKEGKLVICLVKSSSHFVVCKGISEDGQILINDPYLNYRNSATADGCTWSELQFSAGQTWVFDPTANTNATNSAGEITISEDVLKKLQNIKIDGTYEATVQADPNPQNNTTQDTPKEETTKQDSTTQDITQTEDTTQSNNTDDKTQVEDTNQTNDNTNNTKDWANQSNNSNSTTTNNANDTNTSNSSNNQNSSNNSNSTSNNTSNSNNSSTSNNSSSENNSNTSNSTTENTIQSSSSSSSSDTKTEASTTDKTDTSVKNETTTDNTSTNSSTSINQNNTIGKVETTNKVDHSTSTDSAVIEELISSTEELNNNSTTGNSINNNNSSTSKQDTTTNTNTEAIPDTRVDKPQIKHKNKKTFEPIINPAFIGAALATLSVGAITVAERDKKNKKKTSN